MMKIEEVRNVEKRKKYSQEERKVYQSGSFRVSNLDNELRKSWRNIQRVIVIGQTIKTKQHLLCSLRTNIWRLGCLALGCQHAKRLVGVLSISCRLPVHCCICTCWKMREGEWQTQRERDGETERERYLPSPLSYNDVDPIYHRVSHCSLI